MQEEGAEMNTRQQKEFSANLRHEAHRRKIMGADGYGHAQHMEWLQQLSRKTGHRSAMIEHAAAMIAREAEK